jgi:hypothetical protein
MNPGVSRTKVLHTLYLIGRSVSRADSHKKLLPLFSWQIIITIIAQTVECRLQDIPKMSWFVGWLGREMIPATRTADQLIDRTEKPTSANGPLLRTLSVGEPVMLRRLHRADRFKRHFPFKNALSYTRCKVGFVVNFPGRSYLNAQARPAA